MASGSPTVVKDVSFTDTNVRPGAVNIKVFFDLYRPVYIVENQIRGAPDADDTVVIYPIYDYDVSVRVKFKKSNNSWDLITEDTYNDEIPGNTSNKVHIFDRYAENNITYIADIPAAEFPNDWTGVVKLELSVNPPPNHAGGKDPVFGLGLKVGNVGQGPAAFIMIDPDNPRTVSIESYTATTVISPVGSYVGDVTSNDIFEDWIVGFSVFRVE